MIADAHDCDEDRLRRHLKGTLAEGEQDELASHLDDCQACRDALDELASDGLWSCSDPYGWVSQWPRLLSGQAGSAAMLDALLAAYEAHPAAFFHPDNVSAILLRVPEAQGRDETALPAA